MEQADWGDEIGCKENRVVGSKQRPQGIELGRGQTWVEKLDRQYRMMMWVLEEKGRRKMGGESWGVK